VKALSSSPSATKKKKRKKERKEGRKEEGRKEVKKRKGEGMEGYVQMLPGLFLFSHSTILLSLHHQPISKHCQFPLHPDCYFSNKVQQDFG
jgi:hypothetical protein